MTKAAIDYFSHSVWIETRGRSKVTVAKPIGVLATALGSTGFRAVGGRLMADQSSAHDLDAASIASSLLDPEHIADAVLSAIDQPLGGAISD